MRTETDIRREHFCNLCERVDELLKERHVLLGGYRTDTREFFVHYHTGSRKRDGFKVSSSERTFLEAVARVVDIDTDKKDYSAPLLDDWLRDGNCLVWQRTNLSTIKLVEGESPKFNPVAKQANGENSYAALSHLTRREPFLPELQKYSSRLFNL